MMRVRWTLSTLLCVVTMCACIIHLAITKGVEGVVVFVLLASIIAAVYWSPATHRIARWGLITLFASLLTGIVLSPPGISPAQLARDKLTCEINLNEICF